MANSVGPIKESLNDQSAALYMVLQASFLGLYSHGMGLSGYIVVQYIPWDPKTYRFKGSTL